MEKNNQLKAIDLFHLIFNLDKFSEYQSFLELNKFMSQIKYYCFKDIINFKSFNKIYNGIPHEFAISNKFILNKNNNKIEILYPKNFEKLKMNNNGEIIYNNEYSGSKRERNYNINYNKLNNKVITKKLFPNNN